MAAAAVSCETTASECSNSVTEWFAEKAADSGRSRSELSGDRCPECIVTLWIKRSTIHLLNGSTRCQSIVKKCEWVSEWVSSCLTAGWQRYTQLQNFPPYSADFSHNKKEYRNRNSLNSEEPMIKKTWRVCWPRKTLLETIPLTLHNHVWRVSSLR